MWMAATVPQQLGVGRHQMTYVSDVQDDKMWFVIGVLIRFLIKTMNVVHVTSGKM